MPHPIDRISHTMAFVIPVVEHWQDQKKHITELLLQKDLSLIRVMEHDVALL